MSRQGQGGDHFNEGYDPRRSTGNPGNKSKEIHGYYSDESNLISNMSEEERELMFDMADEICERYENVHGEKPATFELESVKGLVLDAIKRRRFNEFVFSQDYLDFDKEKRHRVYSRILNDYYTELKELGLARDPDTEQKRSEADWFEFQTEE